MRLSVFIALAATTTLLLFAAPAAAAFKVPLLLYNGGYGSNYFRYGVPAYTTTASPQPEVKNAFSTVPNSYQKYIACVPRTFLFEDCTLCFCMDIPNVALCWDYEGDKCAEMQWLVDQQKNVKNNNPNGVW